MPKYLCCLCASDEGVFLDIFTSGDKTLRESLEICLSIKVDKYSILSTKICHKCAYELDQCGKFIQKFKQSCNLDEYIDKFESKNRCNLCTEPGRKGYIFELGKDIHSLKFSLLELHECFKNNIARRDITSLKVCLTCRYNLDMLYDLKCIFEEGTVKLKKIIDKKAILSELPKTETFVVSRKTTFIRPSKLELSTPSDSDSDSNTMARRGGSRGSKLAGNKTRVKPQLRTCDECQTEIENGIDMYRFHRTGLTVCKSCWITMDPLRNVSKKRKKRNSTGVEDTKLCTVFLKDVLTNASFKDERVYRIEKDEQGNTMFIVTDDSSEGEDKLNKRLAGNKKIHAVSMSPKAEVVETKRLQGRLKRSVKDDGTDNEKKSYKKLKYNLRQSDIKADESTTVIEAVQTSAMTESPDILLSQKRKKANSNQSSDSDVPAVKSRKESLNQSKIGAKKQTKVASVSDVDSDDRDSRIKSSGGRVRRIGKSDALKSYSEDSSSCDDNDEKKETQKKSSLLTREGSVRDSGSTRENLIRTGNRSSSVSSKESSSPVEFKSPSQKNLKASSVAKKPQALSQKTSQKKSQESEIDRCKLKADKAFACMVCGTSYRNKLMTMTHELTHTKQLEVKLHRVKVPNVNVVTKQRKSYSLGKLEMLEQQLSDGEASLSATHVSDECKDSLEVKSAILDSQTDKNNENQHSDPSLSTKSDLDKEISGNIDNSSQCNKRLVDEKNVTVTNLDRTTVADSEKVDDKDSRTNTAEMISEIFSLKEKDISVDSTANTKMEVSTVTRSDSNVEDNSKVSKECNIIEVSKESNKVEGSEEPMKCISTEEIVETSSVMDKLENNSNVISIMDHNEIEEIVKTSSVMDKLENNSNIISIMDQNETEERDGELESETDIRIIDTGSSENSIEHDVLSHKADSLENREIEIKMTSKEQEKTEKEESVKEKKEEEQYKGIEEQMMKEEEVEATFESRLLDSKVSCKKETEKGATELISEIESLETIIAECEDSKKNEGDDSVCTATEILKEVFDLATAEVQLRLKNNVDSNIENTKDVIPETLENISKEINSADMPSLDPIIDEAETNSRTQEPDGGA